jgi:hypothetical protein
MTDTRFERVRENRFCGSPDLVGAGFSPEGLLAAGPTALSRRGAKI